MDVMMVLIECVRCLPLDRDRVVLITGRCVFEAWCFETSMISWFTAEGDTTDRR